MKGVAVQGTRDFAGYIRTLLKLSELKIMYSRDGTPPMLPRCILTIEIKLLSPTRMNARSGHTSLIPVRKWNSI